jgi:hypothetical protein
LDDFNLDDYDEEIRQRPDLAETLAALAVSDGSSGRVSATVFYGLSSLTRDEVAEVAPVWAGLSAAHRRRVMRGLVETGEADIEMDYRSIGLMGLDDPDPVVREAAIEVLWEDESLELMSRLVQLARHDEVREVRAAAVSALGRFILAGELGHIEQKLTLPAQEAALHLLTAPEEDVVVVRRALEAISNCSHAIVPQAIEQAYHNADRLMRVSSLFAMGRSCDNRWADIVLEEIESHDPEMRYEAARAAGQLELKAAVPRLAQLVLDDDREVLLAAVGALGEIGGKKSMRVLEHLLERAEEEEDEDLILAVEDAIGNAALMSGDLGGWVDL